MKYTYSGKGIEVSDSLEARVEKKLAKLDRYFSKEESAKLTFSRKRNRENIEIVCEPGHDTARQAYEKVLKK